MIHPLVAFGSIAITFSSLFAIFLFTRLEVDEFFFLTILGLIGVYTVIAMARDRERYLTRRWLQNPLKIIGKYLFWAVLVFVPYFTYSQHSFYSEAFPHADEFFDFYLKLYLWTGLPYFVLAEKFRYSFRNFFNDPYLRVLSLARQLARRRWRRLRRLLAQRHYQTFIISCFVRLHFMPLMVDQIFFTHRGILNSLASNIWSYGVVVGLLTSLVWAIDANNAAIGYFWESVFTKTRFKAMDTNPVHYLITLSCYMPFTIWATTFLPALMDHHTAVGHVLDGEWFRVVTDILGLTFLAGYIASGSSLYFSTSNLTYKAIQTKGPYALVRHPATLCKVGFFGVVTFKFAAAYTLMNFVAYLLWTGIYIARTICEERFLQQFEEYRQYQRQTKYRLIPGIW
ncbi:MAG: hypothetical protein IT288_13075 [Bdellovibrionales bacterium]|nr:hypothetical protein [Bdellovibrionales bacterium]